MIRLLQRAIDPTYSYSANTPDRWRVTERCQLADAFPCVPLMQSVPGRGSPLLLRQHNLSEG